MRNLAIERIWRRGCGVAQRAGPHRPLLRDWRFFQGWFVRIEEDAKEYHDSFVKRYMRRIRAGFKVAGRVVEEGGFEETASRQRKGIASETTLGTSEGDVGVEVLQWGDRIPGSLIAGSMFAEESFGPGVGSGNASKVNCRRG